MTSSLPPKLYFRIGEVAGLVGVEPHVLRYWEREFRSIRPTKSAKGQRVYSRRDVENLLRVKELLYGQGFTIAGAKKKLQRAGTEPLREVVLEASTGGERAERDGMRDGMEEAAPISAVSAASEAPVSMSSMPTVDVRDKLTELRAEIEAFLEELGG